jgi:uncharacterized protein (TIGR03085 family)
MQDLASAVVAEREVFADTLSQIGPDAPTLAGDWTAAAVAAHVVSLDRAAGVPTFVGRSIVTRSAIRLNDAAGRFADAGARSTRRRGFDWAIEQLRSPPPRLLLRPSVAAVGLFEVFVHHEDVRRGSGRWEERRAPDELRVVIPWLLRYQRSRLHGVRLRVGEEGGVRPASHEVVLDGTHEVVLDDNAAEVVLWLAGRRAAARVELRGDPADVAVVEAAAVSV